MFTENEVPYNYIHIEAICPIKRFFSIVDVW